MCSPPIPRTGAQTRHGRHEAHTRRAGLEYRRGLWKLTYEVRSVRSVICIPLDVGRLLEAAAGRGLSRDYDGPRELRWAGVRSLASLGFRRRERAPDAR